MAINKKLIHFKTKQKFEEELAKGNILNTSIVFILDTTEIYTHGLLYDGSKVDLSNIEASILNILDNYATKKEIPTKLSLLTNDANYILEDVLVNGVYAVTATNNLVDLEHADTSCVGVAIVATKTKFIINKLDLSNSLTLYWGKNLKGLDIPDIENVSEYDSFDYTNGKNNTKALISSYNTLGVEINSRDISKSLQAFYENGDEDWYLPTSGLLINLYRRFTEINEFLSKIGGTLLVTSDYYWSSNESSEETSLCAALKDSSVIFEAPKNSLCRARLVKDLPEPKLVKERIGNLETEVYELEQFKGTISAVDTNDSVDEPEINNSINVLDNGNIKVTINGVSKDFMPATPSGDPMHYYYESLGAQWNNGEDKTLQIPIYGKDKNTIEYFPVVHKSKRWYLNLLGDITNAQMANIVSYPRNLSTENSYNGCKARTVIFEGNGVSSAVSYKNFCVRANIESLYVKQAMYPSDVTKMFYVASYFRYMLGDPSNNGYIIGYHGFGTSNGANPDLVEIRISNLKGNALFPDSNDLSKTSVLFMVNEANPTTAITITLHPTAYARVANDEEVIAALEAKNAALQETGGSISIVSA